MLIFDNYEKRCGIVAIFHQEMYCESEKDEIVFNEESLLLRISNLENNGHDATTEKQVLAEWPNEIN